MVLFVVSFVRVLSRNIFLEVFFIIIYIKYKYCNSENLISTFDMATNYSISIYIVKNKKMVIFIF